MRRVITAAVLASLAIACGPEGEDDEPEVPGTLVYDDSTLRIYQLDRRIDIIMKVEGQADRRDCGILSERAYTELEDTLSALEPHEDYGYDPDTQECEWPPGAYVHIEGFEHSPFLCDFQCCRPELIRASLIYWLVAMHFGGYDPLVFDGEPYIAIEPDQPCP